MTTTGAAWGRDLNLDRHVLRGHSAGPLDRDLLLLQAAPAPNVTADTAPRPSDVADVRFVPRIRAAFAPVINAFGVRVDTATGEVEALATPPAPPLLRNLSVDAIVSLHDASQPGGQRDLPAAPIRVHVHGAVTAAWLGPARLSIHQGADGQRLGVLAQFDDGTVGDLTHHRGITWASAGAAVAVDPVTGELTGTAVSGPVRITATLPADLGGGTATGDVAVMPAWGADPAAPPVATLVGGPGRAAADRVPNVLFVAEGFTATQAGEFADVAGELARKLQSETATSPFNLLRGSINYWCAFVPSPQGGVTALHELRVAGTAGTELPAPAAPDPNTTYGLAQLLYEVGLPVPADATATLAAKRAEWTALFPSVGIAATDTALFDRWRRLSDRRLANERDSALGLAAGQRPAALVRRPPWFIGFHPLRRTTRAHLDGFLTALTDGPGGPVIGRTWVSRPVAGKDRNLVMALCAGAPGGGGLEPDWSDRLLRTTDLVISGLVSTLDVRLAPAAGRQVDVDPYPVPRNPNGTVIVENQVLATFAHETAHAFGLGEEYGGLGTLPAGDTDMLERARARANVQPGGDLSSPLTATLVKWRWPRLRRAGKVVAPVLPVGARAYLVLLAPGHGREFSPGDTVRLRQALTDGARAVATSGPLTVVSITTNTATGNDEVRVDDQTGTLVAGAYLADSVLCEPVPAPPSAAAAGDAYAELMAQAIRAHITSSHGPLNAPRGSPTRPCARMADPAQIQDPTNLPPGLPPGRPLRTNHIVGLYEGGEHHDCGTFHPTGICMMRQLVVPAIDPRGAGATPNPGKPYRFCHVCQYVLVDRIDPRLHRELDQKLVAKEYPQP